jgi:TrmH family RNA methyltransferase
VITSPDNTQLKLIRKLQRKKERDQTGLFSAEGEDLIAAAHAAGWKPETLLRSAAGEANPPADPAYTDVEPALLDRVSSLGSGSRVIGIYRQQWSEASGGLAVYLHGMSDPGNVGTVIRAAHGFCDGPVILGPECADPWSPKAVRASMGSIFHRPPARGDAASLAGTLVALDGDAPEPLAHATALLAPPVVLCIGAERDGLPGDLLRRADVRAVIPLRAGGPESLNAAMAAAIGLYEVANRMAADG